MGARRAPCGEALSIVIIQESAKRRSRRPIILRFRHNRLQWRRQRIGPDDARQLQKGRRCRAGQDQISKGQEGLPRRVRQHPGRVSKDRSGDQRCRCKMRGSRQQHSERISKGQCSGGLCEAQVRIRSAEWTPPSGESTRCGLSSRVPSAVRPQLQVLRRSVRGVVAIPRPKPFADPCPI